jgi:hypothetical protein
MLPGLLGVANAQRFDLPAVFETGENEDVSGWTFYLDPVSTYAGSYNWGLKVDQFTDMMGGNTQIIGTGGASSELSQTKYDWAVLPVQDLQFYKDVQLKFTYLKGILNLSSTLNKIKFYAMNIPDGNLDNLYNSDAIETLALEGSMNFESVESDEVIVSIPNANIGANTYIAIQYYNDGTQKNEGDSFLELTKVWLNVEVKPTTLVSGVTLEPATASLTIGGTEQLTATITPEDATNPNVSWASSNPAVATVDANGLVTAVAAGNAGITVTTGDGGFTATCAVAVSKAPQTISNYADIGKTYGDAAFDLSATATSGLELTYSVQYDTIATISGSTVSIVGAGTTAITASQAGNGNYEAVDSTITLTVAKAPQTISGLADITKTTGDADFDLAATATSGLEVAYNSSNTGVATISGSTVHLVGEGTTTITASQSGNANYEAATGVTATLTVDSQAKQNQDIDNFADIGKTYGDAAFDLSATATSGLELTYSVQYDTIATISGSTVTITGAGTTTITASQAGNDTYNPVSETVTLTVNKASQTIENFADINKRPDDADFALTATATSGLEISYSIADESIATVSNGMVHIAGRGATTITAAQDGNENYEAAAPVTIALTVDFPDAVNEIEGNHARLLIFPNPATNGEFTVKYPDAGDKAVIRIATITGKQVLVKNIAKNSTQAVIPVHGFTSGIYFVAFSDENRDIVKKLVINK